MKLSALQQGRRSNSFRGTSPLDSSVDGAIKSPAAIFWLVLHGLCCLISLVLGFRFSRIVFFLLFSNSSSTTSNIYTGTLPIRNGVDGASGFLAPANRTAVSSSSRVVVGRHGILIRPWPHPNPEEVMMAHRIIESVQREQKLQYGVKNPRTVIAITPTYVRTFQTLHLTGLMHSLMNVPYDVVWIVVEAGGVTNETASLLAKSGLKNIHHIGFPQKMPLLWEDRHKLEVKMRIRALREVRKLKLDGVVVFADDSNIHSLEFFDEIQKVEWIGSVSVGILAHSGASEDEVSVVEKENIDNSLLPIQGPACNSSNHLVGWQTFNSRPFVENSARYIGDRATVLPMKLEWAGFAMNSRLVWKRMEERPQWVKDFGVTEEVEENIESPLSLVEGSAMVEPLGNCGRKVMLWWLRVEARVDSKFPAGWTIDPPLDVTVPAKRTPWPDVPPELPSAEKVISIQENVVEKRSPKPRSPRKRRSKRKHVARIIDENISTRQSGEN